jgi:hypothetical protein
MEEKTDDTPPRTDLSNIRDLPPPEPKPQRDLKVELLPYDQREGISAHDRLLEAKANRPSPIQRVGKGLVGLLVVAALLLGLFRVADAIDDDKVPTAPWNTQQAPNVAPAPLGDQ